MKKNVSSIDLMQQAQEAAENALKLGIIEKGKTYNFCDDGVYEVWTAGGQAHRKMVLGFIEDTELGLTYMVSGDYYRKFHGS